MSPKTILLFEILYGYTYSIRIRSKRSYVPFHYCQSTIMYYIIPKACKTSNGIVKMSALFKYNVTRD